MIIPSFVRIYIFPAAVYEAITIGGGYGTGREIVQYFTQFGTLGGLLGMGIAMLTMGVVLATTFEFARRFQVYDYRSLVARLIGRAWILYELLAVTTVLTVMAVTGAAAGNILLETFGIPVWVGVVLMLALVMILNFYGREIVIRVLALWVIFLAMLFVAFFMISLHTFGGLRAITVSPGDIRPGWLISGLQYALYNVTAIPMMLYATRGIETRRQSILSGAVAAISTMSIGILFQLAFTFTYPAIVDQPMPLLWMIGQFGMPALKVVYIVVLVGTLIKTCTGFMQGVSERLDYWQMERKGVKMSRSSHALIAGATVIVSGALSSFGIIALIAKGYGSIAWGSMVIYVIPMLTIGIYKLSQAVEQSSG